MSLIPATATYSDDVPMFGGQAIFGDVPSFSVQQITPGTAGGAAAIAAFLGLEPGAVAYGPAPDGSAWGVKGALIAPTSAAVAAMKATILSFVGVVEPFGMPTGLRFPGDFQCLGGCHFVAAEFVPSPGGIGAIGGGMYSLPYLLVIRQLSGAGVGYGP